MKPVEHIKRGEFVRKVNKDGSEQARTYQRGDYCPSTKRFALIDCDNVSREVYVKRGTILSTEFTY